MGAILDALSRVQKIERDLNVIRNKRKRIEKRIQIAKRHIDENAAARLEHRQRLSDCQKQIDQADLDVKTYEASMDKHRTALNAAKSNKEYAAILTALNTEKADAAKRESRVLQMMAELDTLKSEAGKFDQNHERLLERVQQCEADLREFIEQTDAEYQRLQSERQEAAAQVPLSAIQTFERIADRHDGEGLVDVMRVNSRGHDYVCGGCNMTIPLEHVNQLRGRDELQLCHSCGRILCLESTVDISA